MAARLRQARRPASMLADVAHSDPVMAYGDEPLRMLAFRMADTGVTRIPIVERRDGALLGMVGPERPADRARAHPRCRAASRTGAGRRTAAPCLRPSGGGVTADSLTPSSAFGKVIDGSP